MLATPPVLAALTEKEPMLLYIAATSRVVSTVVVVQLVQRPVYYLSEVLSSSKQNYPHYQKMCYGVYFAAKKLKPYFQEHPITVVCTAPLAEIIGSRDASGRVAKWAIALAPSLLEKGLLVAHQFCLLMAHYWCATSTTPLVFFTNGAPLVRH